MAIEHDVEPSTVDEFTQEETDTGFTYTLDMFKESQEVLQMIKNIPIICKELVSSEKGFETLKTILDQYQEQPHLLDPHLPSLLNECLCIITDEKQSQKAISQAFQYLWLVVKVRGHKIVSKKMPHEVKDLLPVLNFLEKDEFEDDFYGSYILLMWLSIIVYMPFNMMAFDATVQKTSSTKATVVERILAVTKKHLKCAQSSREMAAHLASRFVTRPDLQEYLPQFIDYCFEAIQTYNPEDPQNLFHKMGTLRSLGLIFKHGRREELYDLSFVVLEKLLIVSANPFTDTPLRKFSMKLIQRIGLTFLRPKLASWRYQRGTRSLALNVAGVAPKSPLAASLNDTSEEAMEEEDEDVPMQIEDVIEYLVKGLRDQDTVVRWSAAKGIGRITERLPRSYADDVIGEIILLFSTRESDKSWHGGCLALAEMARRGVLLPSQLPEVMPILEKALVYDELRGQCSVGANIRDAACYMCWAIARAYNPKQLTDFVTQIATGLLIVALFDREIPCRRAASSAFQEHMGRQGNFPNGIELVTTVDYFAVGKRSNAFLNLGVHVGRHPVYTKPLIDHLISKKINHWDSAIRELASKALHNLTPFAPEYVGKTVLPLVIEKCTGPVLIERHGAILAVGQIIYGLHDKAKEEGKLFNYYIEGETLEKVYKIIPQLEKSKLFRGMGGEYMRQAISLLIEKCCLSGIPLDDKPDLVEQWYNILEECVLSFEDHIRSPALEALGALWNHYFSVENLEDSEKEKRICWRKSLLNKYVHGLNCGRETQCLGYAALLGKMPSHILNGSVDVVIEALIEVTKITPLTEKWALTRKQSIDSLLQIVNKIDILPDGVESKFINNSNLKKVYGALLNSLEDYTMDRRGDIGAWVRESSMQALQSVTKIYIEKCCDEDLPVLDESIVKEMMTKICQQSVERIDRTRKLAGLTFQSLLYSKLPNIPNVEVVRNTFPEDWCKNCNWASESTTYVKFVALLDLPAYRPRILLGLAYSLGGVSANLSRYTLEAVQNYLNERTAQREYLIGFVEAILDLLQSYQRDDRIILPLIKSLYEILSSCSALDEVLEQEEQMLPQLLNCLKKETMKCGDFYKLSAIVKTLCELLRIQSSCAKSIMTQLTLFLGYQYPKVRDLTANSFLTALLDYNDRDIVPEEHLEEITLILEDTPWMDSLTNARMQRNKVCDLLAIPPPQPKKKT
ncbi:UNVERIFIED_CONTAM: hypothetical protein RMT77_013348 [Armadillidium vulgare]